MVKGRCDDPIQATVNGYEETPWQEHAQDRKACQRMEQAFIASVLRKQPVSVEVVPPGRHMMHAMPDSWQFKNSKRVP